MNDINFIDITKDHLQLDLIYTEQHYQQEYKYFEQIHKIKALSNRLARKKTSRKKLKRTLKKSKSSTTFSIVKQEEQTQKK